LDRLGRYGHETASASRLHAGDRSGRAIYAFAVNRALVFPPPMPTKDLPEHVRRAMRAFERVHKMLEAKAAAERAKAKRPGR
jgi:hypothetical protein